MRNLAEVIQPRSRVSICGDEDDNRVLECAIDGRAEWIISGDLHLLELQSYQGVKVVTVGDFLNQLERDA
jgi:predicted nucleic acid-binding protein